VPQGHTDPCDRYDCHGGEGHFTVLEVRCDRATEESRHERQANRSGPRDKKQHPADHLEKSHQDHLPATKPESQQLIHDSRNADKFGDTRSDEDSAREADQYDSGAAAAAVEMLSVWHAMPPEKKC
jgi:hypothetical protein